MKFLETNLTFPEDPFDFPVYFWSDKLPIEGNFYIIGKNGFYLHKDTGIIKGISKVKEIPGLSEVEKKASLNIPEIPANIMCKCITFFREVYIKQKSEAILFLIYQADKKIFSLLAPKQESRGLSLKYDPTSVSVPNDCVLLGTIHSHANAKAGHSGTDMEDESDLDGLHITIGNVDDTYPSVSCSVVFSGDRYKVDTVIDKSIMHKDQIILPVYLLKNTCFELSDWMSKVSLLTYDWMSKVKEIYDNQSEIDVDTEDKGLYDFVDETEFECDDCLEKFPIAELIELTMKEEFFDLCYDCCKRKFI